MARINHPTLGDIVATKYRTGTILAVNFDNDTCSIQGTWGSAENVPIFYHCNPEAEIRANGALVGGAAVFAINDQVIVMMEDTDETIVARYVVGFKDGIRSCGGWQFKLTRGDGVNVDDSQAMDFSMEIYGAGEIIVADFQIDDFDEFVDMSGNQLLSFNAFQNALRGTGVTKHDSQFVMFFNEQTKIWKFVAKTELAADKFWFIYDCQRGLSTQYPYLYGMQGSNGNYVNPRFKAEHLITQGFYEDTIPYWYQSDSFFGKNPSDPPPRNGWGIPWDQETRKFTSWFDSWVIRHASVPVEVKYTVNLKGGCFASIGGENSRLQDMCDPASPPVSLDYQGNTVSVATEDGVVSYQGGSPPVQPPSYAIYYDMKVPGLSGERIGSRVTRIHPDSYGITCIFFETIWVCDVWEDFLCVSGHWEHNEIPVPSTMYFYWLTLDIYPVMVSITPIQV